MLKVQLRGGFSDRNGINPESKMMQTTEFDQRTRVSIRNTTDKILNAAFHNFQHVSSDQTQRFIKHLLEDVYAHPVDWASSYWPEKFLPIIYETIKNDDYDSVLTVIEYIVQQIDDPRGYNSILFDRQHTTAAKMYNNAFEKEYVGYRVVDRLIVPITDPVEIQEIESANSIKHKEVAQHFQKALAFLSDRSDPDYANSVKESISAVERMCSIILGKSATLGDALKKLEASGVVIHSALKGAFDKLYGYTSDASGIRHAGQLGGKDTTFEEAKFMLVSCCAFVNYLKGVQSKTI